MVWFLISFVFFLGIINCGWDRKSIKIYVKYFFLFNLFFVNLFLVCNVFFKLGVCFIIFMLLYGDLFLFNGVSL